MTEGFEQIETDFPADFQPIIEELVHNAAIEVRHIPVPDVGPLTLLKFHTPAKTFTFKLLPAAVNQIVAALKGAAASEIVVAQANDIPNLRRVG